jgi:hypothetical protein
MNLPPQTEIQDTVTVSRDLVGDVPSGARNRVSQCAIRADRTIGREGAPL